MPEHDAEHESALPIVAPEFVGPGTRDLTTALLYHGRVELSLPGWGFDAPFEVFDRLGRRAHETRHPLERLLAHVRRYILLARSHADTELRHLQPLQDRIRCTFSLYPGTEDVYETWEPVREACMGPVMRSLEKPVYMATACHEFIWRAFEASAAQGHEDPQRIDLDAVLNVLSTRAEKLGGHQQLLAECGLHRYLLMRGPGKLRFIAGSAEPLAVLGQIGRSLNTDDEEVPTAVRAEAFAFHLFDQLLQPYTRPLHASYTPVLAELMEKHAVAISRMREECRVQSRELLRSDPPADALADVLAERLKALESDVAEIAGLDASATRSFLRSFATDPKFWGAVAGLLGSGALPPPTTAAAGITTLALLGAKAVAARFGRADQLASSPWAFVYLASRVKQ